MPDLATLQIELHGDKQILSSLDKIEKKAKEVKKTATSALDIDKQNTATSKMIKHQKQIDKIAQSYKEADAKAQAYWADIRKSASKVEQDLKKLRQANISAFDREDMRLYRKELGSTESSLRRLKGKIPDREFDRLQREISESRRALNRHTDAVKKASTGMSKLRGAMTGLFAAGATAAGIGYAIKRMLDYADAIGKTADRIGVATSSLQEYRYAANLSGVETSKLDKGLEAFTKRLGEAKQGTGALNSYLKKYNEELLTSIKNANNTEDALKLIADEMGNMETASDKAALGAAAFSRSAGVEMVNMLKKGSKGLEEMSQQAKDAGAVLDEQLIRQAEKTNDSLALTAQILKTDFAAAIVALTPTILRLADGFGDMAKALGDFIAKMLPMQLKPMAELERSITAINNRIMELQKKQLNPRGRLDQMGLYSSEIKDLEEELSDLLKQYAIAEEQYNAFQRALESGSGVIDNNTESVKDNTKSVHNWISAAQMAQDELTKSIGRWDKHTRSTRAEQQAIQDYHIKLLKTTKDTTDKVIEEAERTSDEIDQLWQHTLQNINDQFATNLYEPLTLSLEDWDDTVCTKDKSDRRLDTDRQGSHNDQRQDGQPLQAPLAA